MAKIELWIFLKWNIISSNQAINNYSNEVKFGDPTSLGKAYNKCSFVASSQEVCGENFSDDNWTVKHLNKMFLAGQVATKFHKY